MMERGDKVQTYFDTGAFGARLLYGEVIAAGPRQYTVRWESGAINRLPQGHLGVHRTDRQEKSS